MSKHVIALASEFQRERAVQTVRRAPAGWVVEVREPTRSDAQNRAMWAMLNDISRARPLGRKHTPDIWKAILLCACGYEQQFEMGIDGRPFSLGFRSSHLNKSQMNDFLSFIAAWGSENGVQWSDPEGREEAA